MHHSLPEHFAKWEEGLRPAGLPAHGDMVPRSTIPASPSVVPQLSTGPPNNSFESLGTLANWGFNARRFLVNEETVFSAS
jgi:hypothetical protein